MTICYHGTNEDNAKNIIRTGFRAGTWFATNLQDAISYGGLHIFEVSLSEPPDEWQFHVSDKISADNIVRYTIYNKKEIFHNKSLNTKIFESNLA